MHRVTREIGQRQALDKLVLTELMDLEGRFPFNTDQWFSGAYSKILHSPARAGETLHSARKNKNSAINVTLTNVYANY